MSIEEPDSPELWTFYSADGNNKYVVSQEVAKLSGVFANMVEHSTHEKAVSLSVVNQTSEYSNLQYQINTDDMLNYVYKYFKLWENSPATANYVKIEPIQTSEISHVLKPVDLEYIESFLRDHIPDADLSVSDIRKKKIECLGVLLSQVDEFLDIESLANKIYAYIAVLIWNTSAVDFAEAMHDPEFKQAQESAIADWYKDNPTNFADYVRSHTTDGISMAPAVATNNDILNLEDLSLEAENAELDDDQDSDADEQDDDQDDDQDSDVDSEVSDTE
jgi:hypothetical protein